MRQWISGALAGLLICTAAGAPALAAGPDPAAVQAEAQAPEADAPGTVSWENLRSRIERGSLSALTLTENINTLESIDYQEMLDRLRPQLNALAEAQWYATLMHDSYTAGTASQAYGALRETFDSVWGGDMQKDNADVVRQLQDGKNQILAGGENLYIGILTMEQSARDGARGLDALDRALAELRVRRQWGQVSDLTIQELEQTRTVTASQLASLDAEITSYKIQLQNMLGVEPDGNLELLPLPALEDAALDAIDCEADLAAAKEVSWALYSAKLTLDDAKREWQANRGVGYRYQREMAEHTWNAAQSTYAAAVEEFETGFRRLYRAIEDQRQAAAGKAAAAAYQAQALEAVRTQYELGRVSYSALCAAEDEAAAAQSDLERAQRDLFSACLAYRQAVQYGIVG